MKRAATILILAVVSAAAFSRTPAGGEQATAAQAQDVISSKENPLPEYRFYFGTLGHVGAFPGTLVRLNCSEIVSAPAGSNQCESGSHYHALRLPSGAIYPLLASSERVLDILNRADVTGRKVEIDGRLYPSTAMILVSDVRFENGGAKAGDAPATGER